MTIFPVPLTAIGDAALTWMWAAFREYEAATPALASYGRIRRSATALGTYEVRNARAQAYYFRVVAIVEAYADAALEGMFQHTVPAGSRVAEKLLEGHLRDATQRWEARNRSFAAYHDVRLGDPTEGFPRWAELQGMVQVRNSVAHGLGSLTRQQRENPTRVASSCAQAGVVIRSGEVIVTQDNLERAVRTAEDFVRWLDAKV
jgi:hypothetical protein